MKRRCTSADAPRPPGPPAWGHRHARRGRRSPHVCRWCRRGIRHTSHLRRRGPRGHRRGRRNPRMCQRGIRRGSHLRQVIAIDISDPLPCDREAPVVDHNVVCHGVVAERIAQLLTAIISSGSDRQRYLPRCAWLASAFDLTFVCARSKQNECELWALDVRTTHVHTYTRARAHAHIHTCPRTRTHTHTRTQGPDIKHTNYVVLVRKMLVLHS